MARPPQDPSLLSWPWGSAPSGSGCPSSAVGLTSLPIVNSHAESAEMLADPMVGYWCGVGWVTFPRIPQASEPGFLKFLPLDLFFSFRNVSAVRCQLQFSTRQFHFDGIRVTLVSRPVCFRGH